jgi:hypothetical protein
LHFGHTKQVFYQICRLLLGRFGTKKLGLCSWKSGREDADADLVLELLGQLGNSVPAGIELARALVFALALLPLQGGDTIRKSRILLYQPFCVLAGIYKLFIYFIKLNMEFDPYLLNLIAL